MGMFYQYDLSKIRQFIENLGEEILTLRDNNLQVKIKDDGSKVTNGDHYSHDRLCDFLSRHYPYPIISEEQENPQLFPITTQWVMDPIDGTSHYLKHQHDFSIMLALVHNQEPIMAIIYQPAHRNGYYAEMNKGSFRFNRGKESKPIQIDLKTPVAKRVFQISSIQNYTKEYEWFAKRNIHNYHIRGGIGMKLGAIAEGTAHYFLNFDRPLKVWDVLPSILLAKEAGAWIRNAKGGKIIYDESGYALSQGLVVAPDQEILSLLQETIEYVC